MQSDNMTDRDTLEPRPEVIIDFDVRDGMLFVALKNIGRASAFQVATAFDRPFRGLGGRREVSDSQVFRHVPFMPPGKTFEQPVDVFAQYRARKEPMMLTATIEYRARDGQVFREQIAHDLRIYEDLVTIIQPER
jgi:hypothetical protein